MSFSNVRSRLEDGKLIFYSKVTGEDLLTFDPVANSLIVGDNAVLTSDPVAAPGVDGLGAIRAARFTYDVSGGDPGAAGAHSLGVTLPDNALVLYGIVEILTTFADGIDDSATMALSIEGANDLITATAISSGTFWDAVKAKAVVPDALRLAGIATAIKLTAARAVTMTVAVHTVTAGKLVGWLFYVEGD